MIYNQSALPQMLMNSFVIDLDLVSYLIGGGLDFGPSSCVFPNML